MSFLLGLRQTVKFLVFRKKSEEDGRWEKEKNLLPVWGLF